MACIIGLDIGTTSTIGILIRLPGQVLALASRPVTLHSPQPGWAEEDATQWWDNVVEIIPELLARGGIAAEEVKALGVAGMLPTIVLLDDEGNLLRPSIQQSDGRCGEQVDGLKREWNEADFLAKTGNGINQQLAICKLRWIERHEPAVFRRIATVFGSYDYINWKLTGRRAVEQNWALESGFIDLARHEIADELVALAHVPRHAIPPKIASHHVLGTVTSAGAAATGLPSDLPVVGGAADLIASALGAGIVQAGDVLLKFGGSIDVLTATDKIEPDPRMYLDYHLIPGLYMPNGCMATGGSGLNWFIGLLGVGLPPGEAAMPSLHRQLDHLAAAVPAGSDGVLILPYFLGEKTPIHDSHARGVISGLSLSHRAPHLWRALLEAYAYAIVHHVEVLHEMGHRTENFIVSDGGAQSDIWMQIVADVLQQPVRRLEGHPGSCLGAAWTAAVGAGLVHDWEGISRFVVQGDRFAPNPRHAAVYHEGYLRFRDLYRRLTTPAAHQ